VLTVSIFVVRGFSDGLAMDDTGSNGIPFFVDAPGGLNDEDDFDVGLRLRGINCLENLEVVAGGAADGAPRPKHEPEK
jgi:hypothetical protein